MKLALSTDHAGYEQLKELEAYLEELGYECHNYGPQSLDPGDDYPDFIFPAAHAVADGECERGILMGGSGQGEAMAANRIKGVRCAIYYGPVVSRGIVDAAGSISHNPLEIARLSRIHNDANMLSLAARFLNVEDMKRVAKLWLETDFSGEERHRRRIEKLDS